MRLSTIRLSHHSPITRFAYWGQKHDSPIPGYKGIKVDLGGLRAGIDGKRPGRPMEDLGRPHECAGYIRIKGD
jgi:hypothetical protein